MSFESPIEETEGQEVSEEKDFHSWENPFSAEEWEQKHAAFGSRVADAEDVGEIAAAFEEYASGNEWVLGMHSAGKEYIDPEPVLQALRSGNFDYFRQHSVPDTALGEAIRRVAGF